MIATEIALYRGQLQTAIQNSDLPAVMGLSQQCDRFLRSHLPLQQTDSEDLEQLAVSMEQLLEVYQSAITIVEEEKQKAGLELQSLNRNRANTNKYLDVAGSLKP